MNRNLLLIGSGVFFLCCFLAGVYYLQTGKGSPDQLTNHYTIEVYNCTQIAATSNIDAELKYLLQSTPINDGSDFLIPVVKKGGDPFSFAIPVSIMNIWAFNPALFTFSERKDQEDLFWAGEFITNDEYNKIKQLLLKGDLNFEKVVPGDNNNEFTIYNSSETENDSDKKIWRDFAGLRVHLNEQFASKVFKAGDLIKVFYRCGNPPCIDKDSDGICGPKDLCPDLNGKGRLNGCPCPGDKDRDGLCDDDDQCDDQAGPPPTGCPCKDDDKDNVCNDKDKCPKLKGNSPDGCFNLKIPINLIRKSGTNSFSWNPLLAKHASKILFQYTVNGITYGPYDVTNRSDYCIDNSSKVVGYDKNTVKLIVEFGDSRITASGINTLTTGNLNCKCK